jgi:uncharacterized membrane protein
MVSVKRHIVKTITYRIFGSFVTFVSVVILTKDVKISLSLSVIELLIKPMTYFIHERIWYKYVKFGLKNTKYDDKKITF